MEKQKFIEKMEELIQFFKDNGWCQYFLAGQNHGEGTMVTPVTLGSPRANCYCLMGGCYMMAIGKTYEETSTWADTFTVKLNALIAKKYECKDANTMANFNDNHCENKEDFLIKLQQLLEDAKNEKQGFFE